MTLIGVALVGIMTSNTVAFRKTKSDLDVQNVAEDTFNKISNDIMQAKAVYIKSASNEYKSKLNSKYITEEEDELYKMFNDSFNPTNPLDFDTLKVEDTDISHPKYSLTQLNIDEIGIGYVLPFDSRYGSGSHVYDYCIVTYKFDKAAGTILINYRYKYMTDLNTDPDTSHKKPVVFSEYTKLLGSQGVTGQVDAVNNAIKLTMYFENNDRKFTSDGIITIRNSYVLAEPN
jgi:hypothetical protein